MELPFGKKAMCGNYYVLKHSVALPGKRLKELRAASGIPKAAVWHLQRGSLPYITVGTASDSWRVDFVIGMNMYNALNEIPVAVDGDGNITYYGDSARTLGNIINSWFAYTATVGDAQYQAEVLKAMQDYVNRKSEENKEPLSEEENKEVLDEAVKDENRRDAFKIVYNAINKQEEQKDGNDEDN